MANEFKVKNGLIVIGDLTTSGTITINGATAATQSWVTSQAYLTSASLSGYATQSYVTSAIASLVDSAPAALDTLKELATALGNDASFATTVTNSIASKLSLSGGTMTGQILFQTSALNNGFRWDVNSDAAGITFKNTGDGDNNSYFNFFTEDNGNEYFKFSHNTWNIGSFDFMDVKNGVIRTNGDIYVNASQSGTRSAGTNELINGSRVWHAGDFSSTNISNWNTAYSWGNHASVGYLTTYTDTLATVTGRGASTNTSITVGPDLTVQADNSVNYTASRLWLNSHNNYRGAGVHMSGTGSTWFAGTPYTDFDGGYVIARTGTSNDVSSAQYSNALLTVKSNGNVGIGTGSPSYKLDVNGSFNAVTSGVYLTYNSGIIYHGGSYYQFPSGSYYYLYGRTGMGLIFGSNNAEVGRFDLSGNLGIGTTNPAEKLVVAGGGNIATQVEHTNVGWFRIKNTSTGNYWHMEHDYGDNDLRFGTSVSNGLLTLLSNGNVGIGTVSPSEKLDVLGNIKIYNETGLITDYGPLVGRYNTSQVYVGTGGNYSIVKIGRADGGALNVLSGGDVGIGSTTTSGYKLYVNGSTWINGGTNFTDGVSIFRTQSGAAEVMRVASNSNVGIGINSPQTKLDVFGVDNAPALRLSFPSGNTLNTYTGIVFSGETAKAGILFASNAAGYARGSLIFATSNSNDYTGINLTHEKMRITDSGNVGIGTTSPSYKLHVNGYIGFVDSLYANSKKVIDTADSWLRLNQDGNFGSGVYTPYNLRNDGAFDNYGGIYGYNTIRGRKAQTAGNYTTAALWTESYDATTTGIAFHISGNVGKFLEMRTDGILYWDGDTVLHSGNYSNWAQPAATAINTSNIGSQSVNYANSAGSASTAATATDGLRLLREDNRTISPSELTAGYLKFGFTSWANDNSGPYADFLHLRSYTDASGGDDNLVMFKKSGIGMRIYQQTFGSATAYSSYADVWTTVNFTQSNVNNWNTAYGWGNHASAGYLTSVTAHTQAWSTITSTPTTISGYGITNAYTDAQIQNFFSGANSISGYNKSNWDTAYSWGNHASQSYATTSYVTTQINNLINGAPGVLDTLDELAAALGDDANFATTVTNSIAGKVSKSGDTITGNLNVVGNIYSTTSLGIILNAADSPLITRGWDQFSSGPYSGVGRWGVFMEPSTLVLGTPNIAGNGQVAFRRFNPDGTSATTLLINSVGDTTIYTNLTVGGTITENSSIKLKENVQTSEGNLEKVVNLRPVTYNKIGSQITELGLIAEEVAEVYPEFVQHDENGEPVGVHYSRLTAALIGAVKELTNQVQELNKKING